MVEKIRVFDPPSLSFMLIAITFAVLRESTTSMASFLEQLKELVDLRADGTITDAEFISLKKQVISLTAPPFAVAPSWSSAVDLTLSNCSQTSTP